MDEQRRFEIQRFIDDLRDSELRLLYIQLGERYRLVQRAQEMQAMRNFRLMDKVYFHHNGEHISGTVIRINQRTLSVLANTGRRWTVSPEFLRHEEDSPASNEPTRVHVINTTPNQSPHTAKKPSGTSKRKNKKRKKRR